MLALWKLPHLVDTAVLCAVRSDQKVSTLKSFPLTFAAKSAHCQGRKLTGTLQLCQCE